MRRINNLGAALLLLIPATAAQDQGEQPGAEITAADQEVLDLVRDIEARLEQIRERKFLHPTAAGVYSREQLREFLAEQLDRELPPEKLRGWELAAKAFGMLPAETDLGQTFLEFLTSQVAGFYDPATGKLYCISSKLRFLNHYVMAHELVHAQQDQYHDLDLFYKEVADDDDLAVARQCVVEGEAQYVTDRYANRFYRELAEDAVAEPGDLLRFGLQQSLAQIGAPPYFAALMTFPYIGGAHFVRKVRERGGWEAVATLFQNPPVSSEQVLHPEKFLDPAQADAPREVVLPDLTDRLAAGFAAVYENRLGEFQTEVFVRLAGDPVRALRCSAGWDGDRYRIYERAADGAVLLQWVAVFDTEKDATEMIDALRKVLERRFGSVAAEQVEVAKDGEQTRVMAVAEDGAVRALGVRRGDRVAYLFGVCGGMDPEELVGVSLD